MFRKNSFYVALIIAGTVLFGIGIFLRFFPEIPKKFGGICIGIGVGILSAGVSNLIMKHQENDQPELKKQNEIEFLDERNTMIRNKAKATVSDIIQWLIMGIAYVTILIDAPMWVTLVVVGVFLLKNVLEVYLMNKYQKEL